jgi:hypothetical protein
LAKKKRADAFKKAADAKAAAMRAAGMTEL